MDGGTRDYDVAILGAGLVGLSLAAALARAGMRVAIVDRAPPGPIAITFTGASARPTPVEKEPKATVLTKIPAIR